MLNAESFFILQADPRTFLQETNDNRLDRIVILRRCSIRNQGIPLGKSPICGNPRTLHTRLRRLDCT